METKTKSLRWLLPLLSALFLLSGLAACDSTEGTDDSSGFEQIPYSNPVIAKDFKQSDIEALVEYAVYAQNLRLQFYQISSNGWNGEFFGGPGDKSDASRYFDYLSLILQNSDKYIAAINNLDKNGILTTSTTTRGIIGKLKTAIYGYGEEAQITKDEVLDRLNALRVMGNADLQRKFFNALAPEKEGGPDPRGGHTDPKAFFKSLYAGELNAVVDKIDYVWQHVSAAESFGSEFSDYFEMANDKSGNYLQKVYKRTAKVATSAGEVYLTGVDKIAGGWGSTIVDGLEEIKENGKLMKKTLKGELTGKDVKKYVVGKLTGKLKDTFGDYIGEGIGSEITDPIVEEIEEQVTELIVEGNGDDAKENGVGVVETVEGEGKGVKTTIVVDENKDKIIIGLPDKDGKSVITTKPGKKKITTITTGGERVTQEVTVKEGKNEVEAVPLLEKATVSLSQSPLEFDADGGTATIEVTSNCPYCRVSDEKGDWYSISRKGKVITVKVEKNETGKPRSKTITVEVSQNGKTVDAKTTFTITQKIAEQKGGKISVAPDSLKFEASGGEKSVQVTVEGMEYYGGYVENDNDTWITISTAAHTTLVIKAAANDTGKERSGVVYAYATNVTDPTYKDIVKTPIIITQKGNGELFTITPNPVRFDAQGGEITVTIVGKEVKRIKDVDFHSLKWIGGSGMGLTAVISAQPNTSTAERIADFDIIVEMNDGSTVKQSFTAYQNAGSGIIPSVFPTGLTFEASGGTQSVKVTAQGYTKFGYHIDKEYTSWLTGKAVSGGTVEITAQPNDTGKERTATIQCYVTNVDNATDDQKVFMPVTIVQKAAETIDVTNITVTGFNHTFCFMTKSTVEYAGRSITKDPKKLVSTLFPHGDPTLDSEKKYWNNIKKSASLKGTTAYVVLDYDGTSKDSDGHNLHTVWNFSFEIVNFPTTLAREEQNCMIKNVKYSYKFYKESNLTTKMDCDVTDIPCIARYYGGTSLQIISGMIRESDNVFANYSSWSTGRDYFEDINKFIDYTSTSTIVRDKDNYVTITLDLNINK